MAAHPTYVAMTSTTVYLDSVVLAELRALAAARRVPMAALIRQALERLIARPVDIVGEPSHG